MEYIIYADESVSDGSYFSNFYGGVLVHSGEIDGVRAELRASKQKNNLSSEVKWSKVTDQYWDKYASFVDAFFQLVKADRMKVRLMFTQNVNVPVGLDRYHRENAYHILYYQFFKHAFGLQYATPGGGATLRLMLDQMPGEIEAKARFKSSLQALENAPSFRRAGIIIPSDQIAEVDSRSHPILQGLDIVLGAMQFRLNDKHKLKPPASSRRGRKTIAKERLYKRILAHVQEIRPGFNIGMTTGVDGNKANRWHHSYRHWCFRPRNSRYDAQRSKP